MVRYEEVKTWPQLPPAVEMGEAAGVAVDTTGHVFVFHRPGRGFDPAATEPLKEPAVLEIDGDSGRLIHSWGANTFLVPHGITIDSANNVFLTDVGLQQVFKFSHDGTLAFAVGEPRVGKWDATHFNQPTDIAIRADGSFYVSDGYVNSRVALFDKPRQVGAGVGQEGRRQRRVQQSARPRLRARQHGRDRRRSRKLAAAVVRSRRHVQARSGPARKDAPTTGRVFSVATDADGALYVGIRRADYDTAHTGVLKLDRDWRIVTAVGFGQPGDPVFNAVHDLAVGRDGSIYVAETRTKRVVKLRPVSRAR